MAGIDCIPTSRVCTKCGLEKPFECFGNATKGRWGKKSQCLLCERAYKESKRDQHREYWSRRAARAKEERRARRESVLLYGPVLPPNLKQCCSCRGILDKSSFQRMAGSRDGLQKVCRSCRAEQAKRYAQANGDKIGMRRRRWRERNPDKESVQRKRSYQTAILRNEAEFRLKYRISNRLRWSLARGKESKTSLQILGYTIQELRSHLEKQFVKGMGWHNMDKWDIDHIVPLSSFKLAGPEDPLVKVAWGLPNLRPLWKPANQEKSDKLLFLV